MLQCLTQEWLHRVTKVFDVVNNSNGREERG